MVPANVLEISPGCMVQFTPVELKTIYTLSIDRYEELDSVVRSSVSTQPDVLDELERVKSVIQRICSGALTSTVSVDGDTISSVGSSKFECPGQVVVEVVYRNKAAITGHKP